jgi:transposase
VGTEATSFYDFHVLEYLAQSAHLEPYQPTLYRLNAKMVNRFKKALRAQNKNDKADAFTIAMRLRLGDLPTPFRPAMDHLPLQRLTRFRAHSAQALVREKSYFLTQLFLKFSAYTKIKPFSNPFGTTSQAFLAQELSTDEVMTMPVEALTQLVIHHGRNRFSDPHAVVEKLKKVARESYRIRPSLAQSVNLVLALTYKNIQALTRTIQTLDQAIEKELSGFHTTLQTIPGIGGVYAAGIYAEIGNIDYFPGHPQLAKYAGLVWSQHQSGNFTAEETRMVKAANDYLRYYLVEAANLVRQHDPTFRAFYQRKYQETPKHKHKRALVLTARKLVRVIFAMEKNGAIYRPQ